jgi:hypothetical protein
MQLKRLLVIPFSIFIISCSSPIQKPKGELCTPDFSTGIAQCSDIRNPDKVSELPNEELKVCVTAKTYQNIQNYIAELKRYQRDHCQ